MFFVFFVFCFFLQKPNVQSIFFSLCKSAHFLTKHCFFSARGIFFENDAWGKERKVLFVFFFFCIFDLFIFDFLQCGGNIRSALVQKNTNVEDVVFFVCFLFFLFFCFFCFVCLQKPNVQSIFFSLCKCAHFLTKHWFFSARGTCFEIDAWGKKKNGALTAII